MMAFWDADHRPRGEGDRSDWCGDVVRVFVILIVGPAELFVPRSVAALKLLHAEM